MPTLPLPQAARAAGLVSVDGRQYPLESVTLHARAEGAVALTSLVQAFRNPHAEPLEVVYTLPLPADGAVIGYDIVVGEKRIRGEVRPREEALAAYRDALFQGRLTSLLEQERDDTFSQRLGSVPPGAAVHVEVRVLQPLGVVAGARGEGPRWEYRFPSVAGVRYHGEPGRVPDRARIDPDRVEGGGIPARIGLILDLDGGPGELSVDSTSHALAVSSSNPGSTRVALAENARLDRDVVVRWRAASAEASLHVREGTGLPGDPGRYALLTLTPPAVPATVLPRDLTLLLDASGSMSGPPLAAAKRIAATLLRTLTQRDRFEVLAFSTSVRRLTRGLRTAQAGEVADACAAIDRLQAEGGTEMRKAVTEALAPLREDAQRQVVLVTDGQIGFEHEVIGEILRRSPGGSRLHVVGVGPAPNRTLTRGASRASGGVEVLASSEAVAEEAAARLVHATAEPVLTELVVEGSALAATAPSRPRDVLAGCPSWIAVSLAPAGGTLTVRGRLAGGGEWVRRVEVASTAPTSTTIPLGALFGREAVADVETRAAAGEGNLDREIEALGLRHRIATSRTSLVAVAEEAAVDPRTPRRVEVLPVEIPEGLSAAGLGLRAPDGLAHALRAMGEVGDTFEARRAFLGPMKRLRSWVGDPPELLVEARLFLPATAPATVLVAVDDLLVVEFACPRGGLLLPPRVRVVLSGTEVEGELVPEKSSPIGPHHAGQVVRLAVRLSAGAPPWSAGETLELAWGTAEGPLSLGAVVPPEALTRR
jgi:Ca-activated chloride channel family protein